MRNRLLANLLVLTLCAACIGGVTLLINLFAHNKVDVQHENSFERRTADKLIRNRNWDGAARYYQQLIASDPDNGGATILYAECISRRQSPFLRQIYEEYRSGNPDPNRIREATDRANEIADETIPAFEAALRFPRHRNRASFKLALLHGLKGDKREAVDYLLDALENGYSIDSKISQYAQFQTILDEPEIRNHRKF